MSNPTLYSTLRKIQETWGMSDEQIAALIHVDVNSYSQWMKNDSPEGDAPTVPRGMDHAIALASIYQSLGKKFPKVEDQVKWLFTAHPDFGQHKPIDIAASSPDHLFWLSYYLASNTNAAPHSEHAST
jgi:hypothetical protein